MNEVRVNRKAAGRIASGHPWIFAADIGDRGGAQPGEAVKVADSRGQPLGVAHYSSASQIALRMLSLQVEPIGRDFFMRRLRAAEEYRRRVVRNSEAYRVVHGEADLLPALIVDRYARLPRDADPRPGHGRRQGRDRFLPPGNFPPARNRPPQRRLRALEGAVAAAKPPRSRAKCPAP